MTSNSFEPGQILDGRYRFLETLGRGGMGKVFLCEDQERGEQVALKVMEGLLDEVDRSRFAREIRTLRALTHPHIVALRDVGTKGTLFYTMDYLAGTDLEAVLKAKGAVSAEGELAWVLRLLLQITDALGHLHERRLVHRDLKPANILLTLPGLVAPSPAPADWVGRDGVHGALTDFGLVKSRDEEGALTRSATMWG